jgi:hypothetical protein
MREADPIDEDEDSMPPIDEDVSGSVNAALHERDE